MDRVSLKERLDKTIGLVLSLGEIQFGPWLLTACCHMHFRHFAFFCMNDRIVYLPIIDRNNWLCSLSVLVESRSCCVLFDNNLVYFHKGNKNGRTCSSLKLAQFTNAFFWILHHSLVFMFIYCAAVKRRSSRLIETHRDSLIGYHINRSTHSWSVARGQTRSFVCWHSYREYLSHCHIEIVTF